MEFFFFLFPSPSGLWAKDHCPHLRPALRTERQQITDWARIDIRHPATRRRRRPVRPHQSAISPTACGGAKCTSAISKDAKKSTPRARTSKPTNGRTQVLAGTARWLIVVCCCCRACASSTSLCFFWQVKSRTSARGTAALGNLHGPTSWPATSGSTRDKSRSVATCASVRSHDPTICHCTWSDTEIHMAAWKPLQGWKHRTHNERRHHRSHNPIFIVFSFFFRFSSSGGDQSQLVLSLSSPIQMKNGGPFGIPVCLFFYIKNCFSPLSSGCNVSRRSIVFCVPPAGWGVWTLRDSVRFSLLPYIPCGWSLRNYTTTTTLLFSPLSACVLITLARSHTDVCWIILSIPALLISGRVFVVPLLSSSTTPPPYSS